jgi:hypothetical protein
VCIARACIVRCLLQNLWVLPVFCFRRVCVLCVWLSGESCARPGQDQGEQGEDASQRLCAHSNEYRERYNSRGAFPRRPSPTARSVSSCGQMHRHHHRCTWVGQQVAQDGADRDFCGRARDARSALLPCPTPGRISPLPPSLGPHRSPRRARLAPARQGGGLETCARARRGGRSVSTPAGPHIGLALDPNLSHTTQKAQEPLLPPRRPAV